MTSKVKSKMEKDLDNRASGRSLGEATRKLETRGVLQTEAERKAEEKALKKAERDRLRIAAAEKYQANKARVLKRELTNYSEIILLQDKDRPGSQRKRWWKIFGHSAIILKHQVARIHGLTYAIHEDTDFGPRSEEGVILIPNLENFLDTLKRKGYKIAKEAKECVVVDLGEQLSVEQYEALLEIDENLKRQLHTLLRPKYMLQGLNVVVKELDKLTGEMVRKMDVRAQESYGNAMEEQTMWMKRKLMRAARGSYDYKQYLEEMTDKIEELWGYIAIVMDRRSVEYQKIVDVGRAIRAVETEVEKEKKALKKKEENDLKNRNGQEQSGDDKDEAEEGLAKRTEENTED